MVLLTIFAWFKKIFGLEEKKFSSSDQTHSLEWIKAFGWTFLLTLQNILLMLQNFWASIRHLNLFRLDQKYYLFVRIKRNIW